jgi:hypothetical protein
MMDSFPNFARAAERLNPMAVKRRQWAEEQARFDACMDRLNASLERSRAAWEVAAAEAGMADPDPFFQPKGNEQ